MGGAEAVPVAVGLGGVGVAECDDAGEDEPVPIVPAPTVPELAVPEPAVPEPTPADPPPVAPERLPLPHDARNRAAAMTVAAMAVPGLMASHRFTAWSVRRGMPAH